MDVRKRTYFGTAGFIVLLAVGAVAYPAAHNATSALMVFLFPAGFALAWFVEQSLEENLKHRTTVRVVVALIGLFWLYLFINF